MDKVSEKHDVLFHYTNGAGLKGILESQTLHATHYKYSNDTTEMVSIAPKLRELAEPSVRTVFGKLAEDGEKRARMNKEGGIDKIVIHSVKALVDSIYNVTFGRPGKHKFFEPYFVSFCGHTNPYERESGLLSQWRGYGLESGYALVFDTKRLEELLLKEVAVHGYDLGGLGDVIYAGDEVGFKAEFPALIKAIQDAVPLLFDKKPANLSDLYREFVSSVSRYKHQGFREEQEVRLYLSPRDQALSAKLKEIDPTYADVHKDKKVKSILFKDKLTPYINLFHDIEDRSLPITKIIVGPHADKEGRRERLNRYLELKCLPIEATCSLTPFV
jgi:hypothetical protein